MKRAVELGRGGSAIWLGILLWWFSQFPADAETKLIRLRNEVITTATPAKGVARLQAPIAEPAVSGLYLVQFTNHIEAAWGDQLRAIGVNLLHYVPDDAFVAHVKGVRLSTLRRFGF